MRGKRKKHSRKERAQTAVEAVLVLEILRAMIELFTETIKLLTRK